MFGMGCSGSAPIQEINAEEDEGVNLSKENSANGIADQQRQPKADGIETTANSLQGTNPAEGNQQGSDRKKNSLRRLRLKRDGEQIINDAWGKSTATKNVKNLESLQSRHKPAELVDLESEYGKDGIDLASSHVHRDHQEKEKLINCDGTNSVDSSERMSNQRNIYRVITIPIN